VHGEHLGAATGIGERDRHLAAQCGISRFELDHFDDPFVRHERHETIVVRVRMRGRLAAPVGAT
jgi:hypothetical protein